VSNEDRAWLLAHLAEQARYLAELVEQAGHASGDAAQLLLVRDEVFTIRETLDTLGVPHALAANDDWNRAIGTTAG